METLVLAVKLPLELEAPLAKMFTLIRDAANSAAAATARALVVDPSFKVTREVLRSMPKLEVVATLSVGVDSIDLQACRESGIAVAHTPGAVTEDTADTAMALILATMRRICAADQYVRQGRWPREGDFPLAHKVSGKHVGVVGLGRIGQAIARRARAFDCKVSYFSRSSKPEVPYTRYQSLVELARECDVLVISCELTSETLHLVNRQVLDALGSKGTLVNVARGAVVDEEELVRALLEGRLGAAGLDVFEREPLVHPQLVGLQNVVLVPHIGSATWESSMDVVTLAAENLEAYFTTKTLLTPVVFP